MPRIVIIIITVLLSVSTWAQAQPAGDGGTAKPTKAAQREGSSGKAGARRSGTRPGVSGAGKGEEASSIGLSAEVDRARAYYQSGDYDSCKTAYRGLFERMPKKPAGITAEEIEEARIHYAACLFALGDKEGADKQLRLAIEDNPLMAPPDQVVFPQPFRDLFFKAKADFQDEAERQLKQQLEAARAAEQRRERQALEEQRRVNRLEQLAAKETVVHRNRRWVAALPFGVGQFQNGEETLGAIFLTTELALLTATVVAVSRQLSLHSQAGGGTNVDDPDAFNDPIRLAHAVELSAGAGFLALSVIGIIEAQVSFVEEVDLGSRQRVRPPPNRDRRRAAIQPTVGAVPGGATLGFGGAF